MLYFSYNTNGLQMEMTEAIVQVANAGYQGIELAFDDDFFHPKRCSPKQISHLVKTARKNHIEIAAMTDGCADLLGGESTHEPSMISPNFSDRMQRVHLLQRCIEIAEYAACPVLNLVSGRKRQDCTEKESMQRLEDSLSQLLTFCSETTLVIEPEPGMFIETTQQAKALIEKMRNPRLKMNIDLGHVKCSEPDYLSRIEKAIPYAAHCHLEDILGNVHHHLIPGEGDMDFQTIFRLMELHGYGGYLSVELYPQVGMWKDALYRSIRHITKILAQNRDRPEVQR